MGTHRPSPGVEPCAPLGGTMPPGNQGGHHDCARVALAPHPALGGDRLRRELDHPHGVALAQERLPPGAERGQGDGRPAPVRHPPGRLHDPPALEPEGHAIAGVRGEVEEGPGHDRDRASERPAGDGEIPRPVVPLFRRGRLPRRLRRGARAAHGRGIPARVPVRRGHRVHRILGRALADLHLVPPLLDQR